MTDTLDTSAVVDRGREDGKADASWVFDGNTPQSEYVDCIKLDLDGDPEWGDRFGPARGPLSGEYSGDLTPAELIRSTYGEDERAALTPEDEDALCSAYEDAYHEAWHDEVMRMARYQVVED